jgi:alkyl sulfatase BDS1-like metallo-beta-lactamase superfamily hydrolase
MARRAQCQFGMPLPRSDRGNVDTGLGKWDSRGAPGGSLIAPTDSIDKPVENRTVDGVAMSTSARYGGAGRDADLPTAVPCSGYG